MGKAIFDIYELGKQDSVTLKVDILYGQVANSRVYLDGKFLKEFEDSFTFKVPGTGETLHKKKLFCSTIVSDINIQTNNTGVTLKLEGGFDPYSKTREETVASHGDTAEYTAEFKFYAL